MRKLKLCLSFMALCLSANLLLFPLQLVLGGETAALKMDSEAPSQLIMEQLSHAAQAQLQGRTYGLEASSQHAISQVAGTPSLSPALIVGVVCFVLGLVTFIFSLMSYSYLRQNFRLEY
jgi:hypothetical protein